MKLEISNIFEKDLIEKIRFGELKKEVDQAVILIDSIAERNRASMRDVLELLLAGSPEAHSVFDVYIRFWEQGLMTYEEMEDLTIKLRDDEFAKVKYQEVALTALKIHECPFCNGFLSKDEEVYCTECNFKL